MTDIKKGDRVKVTIEAEVTHKGGQWIVLDHEHEIALAALNDSVSVEKIEPPVETFGPGDMLRSLSTGSYWYLATNGYVRMVSPDFPNAVGFFEYADGIEEFTSDLYERVSLD